MIFLSFLVISTDFTLGKVDKSSLSDHTLMELFIGEIEQKNRICLHDDDISVWRGVQLNENGSVICIRWASQELKGTIDLQWLPPSIRKVDLIENSFYGTADLTSLPDFLEDLNLCNNKMTGGIDLTLLPEAMKFLDLHKNSFSEAIDLTQPSKAMRRIYISSNELSGPLDVTRLPESLETLFVNQNHFSGETDFSHLPKTLTDLYVCENVELLGTISVPKEKDITTFNTKIKVNLV